MLQTLITKEAESSFAVGVDIGSSHITTAIIDLNNRCVVKSSEIRAHLDAHRLVDEIPKVWFDTIERNVQKAPVPIQGIGPSNIQIRNDTEAFVDGEVMSGAAKGYDHAVGIIIRTGLGSAKSHFGVTEDINLGFSMFKEGIAEDYISTRWFVKKV